jgi:hypothetical protein
MFTAMDEKRPPPEYPPDNDHSNCLACCCGREDCPFLIHSSAVLGQVQSDAQKAGELGQVREITCSGLSGQPVPMKSEPCVGK